MVGGTWRWVDGRRDDEDAKTRGDARERDDAD
jgi:hypothetical protein